MEQVTAELNPFCGFKVTVRLWLPLGVSVTVPAERLIVKLCGGGGGDPPDDPPQP
jgi:hypothetical protein